MNIYTLVAVLAALGGGVACARRPQFALGALALTFLMVLVVLSGPWSSWADVPSFVWLCAFLIPAGAASILIGLCSWQPVAALVVCAVLTVPFVVGVFPIDGPGYIISSLTVACIALVGGGVGRVRRSRAKDAPVPASAPA